MPEFRDDEHELPALVLALANGRLNAAEPVVVIHDGIAGIVLEPQAPGDTTSSERSGVGVEITNVAHRRLSSIEVCPTGINQRPPSRQKD